ncbi:MAG: YqgE/AlgH family protein [Desulfatibacillaceae bacterium]
MSDEHYDGSLRGQLLIAMPALEDPNFALTVTYLCVHNSEGAFGLVVNRMFADLFVDEVLKELEVPGAERLNGVPVYMGGPVHPGHMFVLHGPPLTWESSLPVSDTVAMTNSMDILEAVAVGRGPESFLVVLGCAGWGPEQLEEELRQNAWLTAPSSDDILFTAPVSEKWELAARSIGIDPALLSDASGNA